MSPRSRYRRERRQQLSAASVNTSGSQGFSENCPATQSEQTTSPSRPPSPIVSLKSMASSHSGYETDSTNRDHQSAAVSAPSFDSTADRGHPTPGFISNETDDAILSHGTSQPICNTSMRSHYQTQGYAQPSIPGRRVPLSDRGQTSLLVSSPRSTRISEPWRQLSAAGSIGWSTESMRLLREQQLAARGGMLHSVNPSRCSRSSRRRRAGTYYGPSSLDSIPEDKDSEAFLASYERVQGLTSSERLFMLDQQLGDLSLSPTRKETLQNRREIELLSGYIQMDQRKREKLERKTAALLEKNRILLAALTSAQISIQSLQEQLVKTTISSPHTDEGSHGAPSGASSPTLIHSGATSPALEPVPHSAPSTTPPSRSNSMKKASHMKPAYRWQPDVVKRMRERLRPSGHRSRGFFRKGHSATSGQKRSRTRHWSSRRVGNYLNLHRKQK